MNIYHFWSNLKSGIGNIYFNNSSTTELKKLKKKGLGESFRITRLVRPKSEIGDRIFTKFIIADKFLSLIQIDKVFIQLLPRSTSNQMDSFYFATNPKASTVKFALYQGFQNELQEIAEVII